MVLRRSTRHVLGLVTLTTLGFFPAPALAQAPTPFTHQGIDATHSPYGLTSGQVDPASGNLTVVMTDLLLPGNAGFNLAIQRVYNSAVFPDYDDGQSTALEEDSWAGIGWRLHFGRVLNPDATGGGETQIEMGDGSRHPLYSTTSHPEGWITTGFWRYDKGTHTLKLPNGVVYEFGHSAYLGSRLGWVRYVTEISDPFGNRITFEYFGGSGPPDGVWKIRQHLSPTEIREVVFTYDPVFKGLATMTFAGRTWQYFHEPAGPAGYSVLGGAKPPLGPEWDYDYDSGLPGELTEIKTPGGGRTTYTYVNATRRAGPLSMLTRVVQSSSASGPDVPAGTWTFSYGQGSNQDTTVVLCPCGTLKYRFNGTGINGSFAAWSAGTLAEVRVEEGGALLELRTMAWAPSDQISPDSAPGEQGVWTDADIHRPLLTQQVIRRGNHWWTTTFDYHMADGRYNDFGRAWKITESGDATRTTTRTFQYGFGPYIVDRTAVEELRIGAQIIPSSWVYDLSNGFLREQTIWGIRERYEIAPGGNVDAVIDAENNRTEFAYSWGQVRDIWTPHTHTTHGINPDGTVAFTDNYLDYPIAFDYDTAGRLWRIRSVDRNPIIYTYDDITARGLNMGRGATQSRSLTLDGFGRTIRTSDSTNLKTRTAFDACGRVVFQSLPYTTDPQGQQGTAFQYDALGRLRTVTAPGNRITTYTYDGMSVTRRDPENRVTVFTYTVFGGPGTERLQSVRDAAGVTTTYEYDVTGALSKVTGPGPIPPRQWVIAGAMQVLSDTQPESGTSTYTYYLNGNLKTSTNALNQTTAFHYNGDNQLISRDAPGTGDDVTLTYDAAGRLRTMTIAGVVTTFDYNVKGQLERRTDHLGTQQFVSTYGYDANENLTQIVYPTGRTVTYELGAEDRLARVRQNGAVFADAFQYDARGNLRTYQTGAITHTFDFDLNTDNSLDRIRAGSALDLTYAYDDVGNVTGITDPRPGMSQTFTYDGLDRLIVGNGPWGQRTWGYDAAGNRTTEGPGNIATYTYHATTRRLSSITGAVPETFGYDAVGRLTQDARGTYTYNQSNLLSQFTGSNVTATYAYDAAGLRIRRTVNDVTTYTVRSATNDVLSEYEVQCGAQVWTRDAIYAAGRLIGAVKAVRQTASVKVSSTSHTVGEAAGSVAVNLVLTTSNGAPLTCPVTASYSTAPGSASPGLDFGVKTGVAAFASGSPSGATQGVTIPIVQDTFDEPDQETLSLNVSSVTGGTVGSPGRTEITITDDDALPVVSSVAEAMQYEGNSGVTSIQVNVFLSPASGRPVQVSYASSNSTAIAGSDYQSVSGTLTFAPGVSNQVITVPVYGDGAFEPNETLLVTLSAPVNATLSIQHQTQVRIINDDSARDTWGDFYVPRDGSADAALLRPSTRVWTFKDSNTGNIATFGPMTGAQSADVPIPADYTGDGITDCATYRPSTGAWTIAPSCLSTGQYVVGWGGQPSDVPVPADYDEDGRADIAVYRRATNYWHILFSSGGSQALEWGWNWTHVIPTPGDYDGDGKADHTYYAGFNASWWVYRSSNGTVVAYDWGQVGATVIPAQGDYDGDGRTDPAYFYPANAHWYILRSSTGTGQVIPFGNSTMTPVPADYDGDGKTDIAHYDSSARVFWVRRSSTGTTLSISMATVSQPGDKPVLKKPQ